jgi:hypothetical protein
VQTACRSSFIIRSIREAGEEARELLSAEAGYRCEIGDRKQIRGSKRLMSGYDSERCPSIERYTKASGCHIPIVRETEPTAPEDSLLFLHCLDVLPPYGGGRFTQSECRLGQLQIVCRKPHQMFGHARLSTLLCESYAPFG